MTRLELRVVIAAVLAATVVLGRGLLRGLRAGGDRGGAGDLRVGRRRLALPLDRALRAGPADRDGSVGGQPFQPLLPVMAAIMGLTQAVVRSLSDVTDAAPTTSRRWDLPVRRWMEITRGDRRSEDADDDEFED